MPPGQASLGSTSAQASVAPSPSSRKDHAAKRKETLRTLLEALNELNRDDGDNPKATENTNTRGNFEDDHDVPTVDEHFQRVGAEAFHKFQGRILLLDTELRNFSNASRQLGSSVGILSSAFHLRERLSAILHLFHENAADLFPRRIQHLNKEPLMHPIARPTRRFRRQTTTDASKLNDNGKEEKEKEKEKDEPDLEDFPNQLYLLGKDIMTLLNCLNEFPEFSDEAVNASIKSFEADLKYWASCLKTYKGQFRFPAVQRYLHDLTGEMSEQLDSITSSLSYFTEVGVPTIRENQKHGAANLQNLSTVATFFSAVTATTLQFSFDAHATRTQNAVNAFWFASLVFSIASAVNSLLGLTWKQAMYRSPRHRVPWWVLIWIKRSPLVFLVVSVASFSIGLVLFAYSSEQHVITQILTTVFTAFSSFGLVAVSAWFASERWAYAKHKGKKWLADVLEDIYNRFLELKAVQRVQEAGKDVAKHGKRSIKRSNTVLSNVSTRAKEWTSTIFVPRSSEDTLPTSQPTRSLSPDAMSPAVSSPMSPRILEMMARQHSMSNGAGSPTSEKDYPLSTAHDQDQDGNGNGNGPDGSLMLSSPTRNKFASLVRAAVLMRRGGAAAQAAVLLNSPARQRTQSSSFFTDANNKFGMKGSRVATLTPKLKSLEPMQDLAAHIALVKHLQFSPDGKFLATSSWDRTSQIFRVGEPFKHYRVLAHPQGFVGQVAWSPNGKLLMTKLGKGVKIWTQDGVCKKTINRPRNVVSVTWLADGETFLSVEGKINQSGTVVKLDLAGSVLDEFVFPLLYLHDVTVTNDGVRLLGVGTLLKSSDGYTPSKCRAEKRIFVYNMADKEIENQVPVLNDVRDITMAKNGQAALVSYENQAPPQLWTMNMVKDKEIPNDKDARLVLRHTYMPKAPVDFAGPSYFGGKNDELVLCAGKAGDIHIWDKESGVLLHHVRAQASGGDLTCIAWNHAANDPFMFATGSHDGAIRIWTTPPPPSLRNSQSFVIDIRAPSPGVASFVEAGGQPSPAPSLSPNTSGRTTPNKAPQSLFSQEIQYSPITDTFVQHSPAEFGESSRLSPPPRSRPGSPERILLREGDIPMGDGKRVIFQTPRNSMDR